MAAPIKLRPIPLWKEGGWTREFLAKKKGSTPRGAFDRGWHLRAVSDEDLSFPDFPSCFVHGLVLGTLQRRTDWPAFTGVDLAGRKRPGNAIVTVRVDPLTRRRYPVDLRAGAWRSHEVVNHLTEINELYSPEVIKVEDNGYQEALIDWIQVGKYDFWYKVEGTTTTGHTKYNEEVGLPALQVEFQNKAWCIPADEFETQELGHMSRGCPWCRWVYEFSNHPLAASSDYVMATWFARQGIEQIGYAWDGANDLPDNLGAR